jgi:hypothetical protein
MRQPKCIYMALRTTEVHENGIQRRPVNKAGETLELDSDESVWPGTRSEPINGRWRQQPASVTIEFGVLRRRAAQRRPA